MAVWDFVVISTQALSKIVFVGAIGYLLGLGKTELRILAQINVAVLTPALLFAKITKSLDRGMLAELWFVPVLYVALGFVGLAWSRWAGRLMDLPEGFRRLCAVAVYFSNVNTILIPIMQAVASSPDARFLLRDENDSPQAMCDRSIAYGMVIGIMNNALRWSVGVAILSPSSSVSNSAAGTSGTMTPASPTPTIAIATENDEVESPMTPSTSVSIDMPAVATEQTCLLHQGQGYPSSYSSRSLKMVAYDVVRPYMTPPLLGVLAAIAVVLIPPVQQMLLTKGTYSYSLWSSIDACGDACVPATLLALGGQLSVTRRRTLQQEASGSSSSNISLQKCKLGIILVALGRFLVVPAASCLILLGILEYTPWLVPLLRSDPVLFLTLAIVSATPPAINLITVAQQLGLYENEAALVVSSSYAIGMLALSVDVSVFLWLASCIH